MKAKKLIIGVAALAALWAGVVGTVKYSEYQKNLKIATQLDLESARVPGAFKYIEVPAPEWGPGATKTGEKWTEGFDEMTDIKSIKEYKGLILETTEHLYQAHETLNKFYDVLKISDKYYNGITIRHDIDRERLKYGAKFVNEDFDNIELKVNLAIQAKEELEDAMGIVGKIKDEKTKKAIIEDIVRLTQQTDDLLAIVTENDMSNFEKRYTLGKDEEKLNMLADEWPKLDKKIRRDILTLKKADMDAAAKKLVKGWINVTAIIRQKGKGTGMGYQEYERY